LHMPDFWHSAACFAQYRHWTRSAPEPCRPCRYLELCRGGCHAVSAALTGDFNAPDPECPFVSRLTARESGAPERQNPV
jgi:radical SAM protein with 4Fe4S-binding SPASM domain